MSFFAFSDYLIKTTIRMNNFKTKDLVDILRSVKDVISEQIGAEAPVSTQQSATAAPHQKMKPKKVIFDKSTQAPFEVVFSERGFLIDGTRLSFEELETAISKNYTMILNNGKGTTLDAVKMQKILKYKDIF